MKQGLDLLIDNTTLHRLGFAVEGLPRSLDTSEVVNVLHTVECLVLSSDVVVNGFESQASHDASAAILDWLESSPVGDLITVSEHSDEASQRRIASSVAREMFDRGLLLPDAASIGDLDRIDVRLGRPRGVIEVASAFWQEEIAASASRERLVERAEMAVDEHRTDGLFVYGAAAHEDIVEHIRSVYQAEDLPDDERWARMHVVFRSLFNQRLAEESSGRSYAAPPVRSQVLKTVYSSAVLNLQRAASGVTFDLHSQIGSKNFADEVLQEAHGPLPLLGLAHLLEATNSDPRAPLAVRLAIARELAAPMRKRLDSLEALARTDPAKYARQLRQESRAMSEVGRSKLGLDSSGLAIEFDMGVSLDPTTGGFSVDVGKMLTTATSKVARRASLFASSKRRRISVLSDGLARTVRFQSVEEALRAALGLWS